MGSRRRLAPLWVLLLALGSAQLGCSARGGEGASGAAPTLDSDAKPDADPDVEPDVDSDAKPDAKPQADELPEQRSEPSYELMQKVCASPCAGRFARVQVYRDAQGQVAKLVFDGDIEACSHAPRIFFEPDGSEAASVANKAVEPGSAEAEAIAAKQNAQLEGLARAELLSCFDPDSCAAERIPEGMRSAFSCRSDSDCVECACAPVDRAEFERRGGPSACNIDGEECIATNPACCDGRCVLAR